MIENPGARQPCRTGRIARVAGAWTRAPPGTAPHSPASVPAGHAPSTSREGSAMQSPMRNGGGPGILGFDIGQHAGSLKR